MQRRQETTFRSSSSPQTTAFARSSTGPSSARQTRLRVRGPFLADPLLQPPSLETNARACPDRLCSSSSLVYPVLVLQSPRTLASIHTMATLAPPGADKSHPSAAAPKKTSLALGNLPPKQQGFGTQQASRSDYRARLLVRARRNGDSLEDSLVGGGHAIEFRRNGVRTRSPRCEGCRRA